MAFQSASTKAKAKSTVNKLFENILPGTTLLAASSKKLSSTEAVSRETSTKNKLSSAEIRKLNKVERAKQNKLINKKLEQSKKFQKLVKYNVIKSHKDSENLTPEEQKYLKKLIKKNSNVVNRASEVDDPFVKEEIDSLRNEIIAMNNAKYDRSRDRKLDAKLQSFTEKVKKGILSAPGLTPGLAPVGYDDESDDE